MGTRIKIFLVGFSSSDILTPTSLAQVLSAILQVMLLVLMMLVVCNWFSVNRGVTYYFIWDPGGGWSSLFLLDCLRASNLGKGGL